MALRNMTFLLALGVSSIALVPAAVAAPAFTVSGTPTTLNNPPFTLGYAFSLSQGFSLTGLGMFDAGNDGLFNSYDIGLFDSGGAVVASTTLGSGASGTLIDGYRYASFAPLALSAGDYRIGAYFTNANGEDALFFTGAGNSVSSIAGVSFAGGRFASGGALADPTGAGGDGGYFGPNLLLSGAVPEPATWAMMIVGFGMVGGVMRQRSKTRTTVSFA